MIGIFTGHLCIIFISFSSPLSLIALAIVFVLGIGYSVYSLSTRHPKRKEISFHSVISHISKISRDPSAISFLSVPSESSDFSNPSNSSFQEEIQSSNSVLHLINQVKGEKKRRFLRKDDNKQKNETSNKEKIVNLFIEGAYIEVLRELETIIDYYLEEGESIENNFFVALWNKLHRGGSSWG